MRGGARAPRRARLTSRGFSRHPARFPSVPRGHGGRRPRRRGGHRILAEARIPGYIAPPHERPIPVTAGPRRDGRRRLVAVCLRRAFVPPRRPPGRRDRRRVPRRHRRRRCAPPPRRFASARCAVVARCSCAQRHRSARGGRLAHLRPARVGRRAVLGLQPRRAARRRHHGPPSTRAPRRRGRDRRGLHHGRRRAHVRGAPRRHRALLGPRHPRRARRRPEGQPGHAGAGARPRRGRSGRGRAQPHLRLAAIG
jgi:hypothetical protein